MCRFNRTRDTLSLPAILNITYPFFGRTMSKNINPFWILSLILFVMSTMVQTETPSQTAPFSTKPEIVDDIAARIKQFPRTQIDYDRKLLTEEDMRVIQKLIEASKFIDEIFWRQVSEQNPKLRSDLTQWAKESEKYELGKHYFEIMKGRWDRLLENEPFIAPFGEAGKKPPGAAFYPEDISKEEFENWIKVHPNDKENFQGLFTVIRRKAKQLQAIPYSQYYREFLEPASRKLKEAASIASNPSLRDYLNKRAEAFLSDDYYASDIAWIDLNSPIEVVIGPYEVYEDQLFNYKASFESFITVVDKPETDKLKIYRQHLPEMEMNLPMPDEHKNPKRGGQSALRVVQEIYTAGDARRGVQTAAFNLPNDEKVRESKGFKNVLLKNVMEAKYLKNGQPIARRLLDESQLPMLSFDAFFNHILFHEISHGLGPGIITGPDGKKVENRILLKNLYSTIEEAKADVLGVWNLEFAIKKKLVNAFDTKTLHITNAGLMFRSMRFGIGEAHGRGTALQWNWYREKGAIVPTSGGRFRVDFIKMEQAVQSLANELLLIEATGDFNRAQRLLDRYGKLTPEINSVNDSVKDIPVDIEPVFVAAGESMN